MSAPLKTARFGFISVEKSPRFFGSRAIFSAVVIFEICNRLAVAIQALALDGFHAGHPGIGNLPERLSGVHLGDVNLHSGDCHRFLRQIWQRKACDWYFGRV